MSAYPAIPDWTEYREGRATSILALEPGRSLALGVTDAGDVIEQSQAALAQTIADVDTAAPDVLARLGERYGVRIAGLTLPEARRVVRAARLARASSGTEVEVWAVWLALTGAAPADARLFVLPQACGWVQAVVDVAPSAPFLTQARAVMLRAIAIGAGLHAVITTRTGGIYDATRYDASRYGWSFSITRPGA